MTGFLPGDQVPGVTGGTSPASINSAAEFDFDGAGPAPSKLVVGGAFTEAGGSPALNLATWDGSRWEPFGTGADGPIARLTVHNNQLVAAGSFTTIGGVSAPGGLAAFDGTAWAALPTPGGTPTQLLSWNGVLYACGPFTFNAVPGNYVASFDGTTWSPIGASFDGPINDVALYDGQLMAGGAFTSSGADAAFCLARWDGANWSTFQGGTTDAVNCIRQFGADLYVGGVFTGVGSPPVNAPKCAKWSGTGWSGLVASSVFQEVKTLGGTSTQLVAGGVRPGPNQSFGVRALAGAGFPPTHAEFNQSQSSAVLWAGSYQGRLHIAGSYNGTAPYSGDIRHFGISRLISERWHAVTGGLNGRIYCVAVHQGQIFAGGDFNRWKETPVSKLVTWNGTDWVQFNTAFPGNQGNNAMPNFLKSWHNRLYIHGNDATTLSSYWNGSVWTANEVFIQISIVSMVEFVGDRLMLGTNVGGWRQTSAFSPYAFASTFNREVYTTVPFNGGYAIGGLFTTANGAPVLRVCQSDGVTWTQIGAGLNANVKRLLVVDGELKAFGDFENSGATHVTGAARWNGASWQALGSGLPAESPYAATDAVNADGRVFATANLGNASTNRRLLELSGGAWQDRGALTGSGIFAFSGGDTVTHIGDELWITGRFTHAGGVPTYQFARFRLSAAPAQIISHPEDAPINPARSASFTVAATGNGPLSYTWRRNGDPIGAPNDPTLTIPEAGPADRGIYDCIVTNPCGSVTSNGARLTLLTADLGVQGGDPGSDGAFDNNDFIVFIDLFFEQSPAADLGSQGGTLGGDGNFDNNDFVVFIDLFFEPI